VIARRRPVRAEATQFAGVAKVQNVIRRLDVTEQTYYRRKAKFGGRGILDPNHTAETG
jgi:hypothetical protein